IVFDLDDTLYPESAFVRSGFRAVAAEFAATLGPPDAAFELMWRAFQSNDRRRVFDLVLAKAGRLPHVTVVNRMVETYRMHRPSLWMQADADRALNRLAGRYKLGILTDGYLETQRNKIEALGLASRVDVVLITDELGREFWKPHVRCFEEMCRRLGSKP